MQKVCPLRPRGVPSHLCRHAWARYIAGLERLSYEWRQELLAVSCGGSGEPHVADIVAVECLLYEAGGESHPVRLGEEVFRRPDLQCGHASLE